MPTYAAMVGLGVVVSLALFGISYFQVGAMCLSCIGVYSVTIMQALVLFFLKDEIPNTWGLKGLYNGGFYMLIALLACVSLFQIMEPMPKSDSFTPDLPKSAEDMKKLMEKVQMPEIKIDRSAYSGLGKTIARVAMTPKSCLLNRRLPVPGLSMPQEPWIVSTKILATKF